MAVEVLRGPHLALMVYSVVHYDAGKVLDHRTCYFLAISYAFLVGWATVYFLLAASLVMDLDHCLNFRSSSWWDQPFFTSQHIFPIFG